MIYCPLCDSKSVRIVYGDEYEFEIYCDECGHSWWINAEDLPVDTDEY